MIACITERHKIIREIAEMYGLSATVPDDVVIGFAQAERAFLKVILTWPTFNA